MLSNNNNWAGGQRYAKYYFELRDLAEKEFKHWPLQPLDKERAELLEVCSPLPFHPKVCGAAH